MKSPILFLVIALGSCGTPDYVEGHAWKGATSGTALGQPGNDYDLGLEDHGVGVTAGWRLTPTLTLPAPQASSHPDDDHDALQESLDALNGEEEPNGPLEWMGPGLYYGASALAAVLVEMFRRLGLLGQTAKGIFKGSSPPE